MPHSIQHTNTSMFCSPTHCPIGVPIHVPAYPTPASAPARLEYTPTSPDWHQLSLLEHRNQYKIKREEAADPQSRARAATKLLHPKEVSCAPCPPASLCPSLSLSLNR